MLEPSDSPLMNFFLKMENDVTILKRIASCLNATGLLWSVCLCLLLMAEWYNGYDPHGQFYNNKVEYFGIGLSLGF